MQSNIVAKQLLQREDIDKNNKLLIDPDNVFWALVFNNGFDEYLDRKIISLYNRNKDRLDISMKDFRFKTDLNSVYINPTDRCNADCPYCYIPRQKRKNGKQMSNEQLLYILKKIDKYFGSRRNDSHIKPIIIFHGSEPLLAKDAIFSSIVKFCHKFNFGIQTNAILLNKKDVGFLKSYKVSVGISLDSINPKVNDYTRRSSVGRNYDSAIRAIEWFNGYEGLNVITTITKYNVKNLPKLVRFIHSKKTPCLLLNPVRATRKSTVGLRPNHKDLSKYFIKAIKEAMELSKSSRRRIVIGNFSNIVLGIVAPQARRLMCDISPCGGGRCFFAITAEGNMIPCGEFIALKEFYGGNIFHTTIQKAISSKPFKKVRSRVVEEISECDVCLYRNICGAPCPAEIYSLNKNMHGISPYCEFYKEIIKFAFRLIAENRIKYLFREEAFENIKYDYRLKS
ncbi:MAG: peptide-modifying radical SAM enzyme CbpB [Candidatus Omnitrophica bacterium]|nr:peptide-modifying radical SAM enzyme CbpB [Candidatus Omnitrophota bacterium]